MEYEKRMKLYIDDRRLPPEGYIVIRNYDNFVKWITENGLPDTISFDHDLGEGKTGYDCAKFLIRYFHRNNFSIEEFPEFFVHTQNTVGAENIIKLIDGYIGYRKMLEEHSSFSEEKKSPISPSQMYSLSFECCNCGSVFEWGFLYETIPYFSNVWEEWRYDDNFDNRGFGIVFCSYCGGRKLIKLGRPKE